MSTFSPRVRSFAQDRKKRTRGSSTKRFTLDRSFRVRTGVSRKIALGRALIGVVNNGVGYIAVSLTVSSVPAQRLVRVHLELSGECVRSGTTDAAGKITFRYLPTDRPYTVIAYDDTGVFQAQLWNGVLPSV